MSDAARRLSRRGFHNNSSIAEPPAPAITARTMVPVLLASQFQNSCTIPPPDGSDRRILNRTRGTALRRREDPYRIAVRVPVCAEEIDGGLRQRHHSIYAPLAVMDMK